MIKTDLPPLLTLLPPLDLTSPRRTRTLKRSNEVNLNPTPLRRNLLLQLCPILSMLWVWERRCRQSWWSCSGSWARRTKLQGGELWRILQGGWSRCRGRGGERRGRRRKLKGTRDRRKGRRRRRRVSSGLKTRRSKTRTLMAGG